MFATLNVLLPLLGAIVAGILAFVDDGTEETPERIKRALALFNTGVLLFLGGVLVTIALSVFGPLYQMLGNLNAT